MNETEELSDLQKVFNLVKAKREQKNQPEVVEPIVETDISKPMTKAQEYYYKRKARLEAEKQTKTLIPTDPELSKAMSEASVKTMSKLLANEQSSQKVQEDYPTINIGAANMKLNVAKAWADGLHANLQATKHQYVTPNGHRYLRSREELVEQVYRAWTKYISTKEKNNS